MTMLEAAFTDIVWMSAGMVSIWFMCSFSPPDSVLDFNYQS